jgi:imidazole glycerol-phosphate synthase subunit HisH
VIALIDYGAGNLTSVRKGFAAAGAELVTPDEPDALEGASGIVVPGVGHFSATASLDGPWRDTIARLVRRGTPLLGICLGLQWLFEGSDEAPGQPGLGVLRGTCVRLPPGRKIPHVGWNVLATRTSRLLSDVPAGTYAYFTHSYAAPVTDAATAVTEYGMPFASAVEQQNVYGVQFHPEKSGPSGVHILRNFVALTRRD